MEETIHVPPFPPLTWGGRSWEGEVELPSWTGFQGGDGRYWLVVYAKGKAHPTPEQAAAFRYLLDNEASVFAAIGRALLAYYPGTGRGASTPTTEIRRPSRKRRRSCPRSSPTWLGCAGWSG